MLERLLAWFTTTERIAAGLAAVVAVLTLGPRLWRRCCAWRDGLVERHRRLDRVIALLQDVEKRLTEVSHQVEHVAAVVNLALSLSDQASATADEHGEWIVVTDSMVRQSGRSAVEMLGRGWYDAIDDTDRRGVRKLWEEAVQDHRRFEALFQWRRHDGGLVLVRMFGRWVPGIRKFVVNSRKSDEHAELAALARGRGIRTEPPGSDGR